MSCKFSKCHETLRYKRLPLAAGSIVAGHRGQNTALADPAASYLWLWFVCNSSMVKARIVEERMKTTWNIKQTHFKLVMNVAV